MTENARYHKCRDRVHLLWLQWKEGTNKKDACHRRIEPCGAILILRRRAADSRDHAVVYSLFSVRQIHHKQKRIDRRRAPHRYNSAERAQDHERRCKSRSNIAAVKRVNIVRLWAERSSDAVVLSEMALACSTENYVNLYPCKGWWSESRSLCVPTSRQYP